MWQGASRWTCRRKNCTRTENSKSNWSAYSPIVCWNWTSANSTWIGPGFPARRPTSRLEPDLVFVAEEALDSGRVRLVPKVKGEEDRYIELEGAPDLIVEIVSDSSVRKDTKRLPRSYWRAGVREFWLADARREELFFRIHHRGGSKYEPAPLDDDSYQYSAVLDAWYRLDRSRNARGRRQYAFREK